jgi:hypothetical protein
MYTTLIAVTLVSASIGSSLAKPIPLFPNWIGALLAGGFCGYSATLRDGRGDLLRFMGNSAVSVCGVFYETAGEVDLWSKLNKVSGKSLAYFSKMDQQYKFIEKAKFLLSMLTSRVVSASNR